MNIIAKMRVKFLCIRELEYPMLSILWSHRDSSNKTKMRNLFSEQTSTGLFIVNDYFSIKKYLDPIDSYCNVLHTFHLK